MYSREIFVWNLITFKESHNFQFHFDRTFVGKLWLLYEGNSPVGFIAKGGFYD